MRYQFPFSTETNHRCVPGETELTSQQGQPRAASSYSHYIPPLVDWRERYVAQRVGMATGPFGMGEGTRGKTRITTSSAIDVKNPARTHFISISWTRRLEPLKDRICTLPTVALVEQQVDHRSTRLPHRRWRAAIHRLTLSSSQHILARRGRGRRGGCSGGEPSHYRVNPPSS
jgi:hypothetical protein